MASSKALDWGWFFLRLSVGLVFLERGARGVFCGSLRLSEVAEMVCGLALVLGLFVRPSVLALLACIVTVWVGGRGFGIHLVHKNLNDWLALLGFLIGGGGTFLALGAALGGLRGKWYQ